MALKLMYITNRPEIAQIAESAGVDRIFVDMEYIGKAARQGGMDTVQSHHTVEDVAKIRDAVTKADVMVRINPIHKAAGGVISSKEEIDAVIEAGADIIMLPYFKTVEEARAFIGMVDGRARTLLLLETPEAAEIVDKIVELPGIDEIFIGLNDLSLGYKKKFMFELLADGTVERLCLKFKQKELSYGFGGIASLGKGMLPSEYVIREHYRLGSTCVILSRSFCLADKIQDLEEIRSIFMSGVREIRELEAECGEHLVYSAESSYFTDNKRIIVDKVNCICETLYPH